MPPQSARSITSYFAKASSSSTAKVAKSAAPGAGSTVQSTSTQAESSPAKSSPVAGAKRSFLSDAAKQAILEVQEEVGSAKKAKTSHNASGSSACRHRRSKEADVAEVADVFLKTPSKVSLPKSSSRQELLEALSSLDPADAEILKLEVETLQEDWLLALQGELTKPYFLNVSSDECDTLNCS